MKLKNNIFISIYILITFVYVFINESIYKNIMKPFENLGFTFVFISIIYSLFFNNRYKKLYITLNIVVLALVFTIFTINLPIYTYKESQKIIEQEKKGTGIIIDANNKEYRNRVGIKHINLIPNRNILVDGDYLIYFHSNIDGKIEWYKFNAINGIYELYYAK
ncbi:MAG: hypothetical protein K0Q65_2811 [Clostridia bacterium]|nr:hypothetical protein [Clostridia bacterium]